LSHLALLIQHHGLSLPHGATKHHTVAHSLTPRWDGGKRIGKVNVRKLMGSEKNSLIIEIK